MWKLIFECKKKTKKQRQHCLLCGWARAWDQGQVTGVALSGTESLLTVDLRDAESAESSLTAAEKVIVTPKNLKSDVWKYFGFWAVDCKLVEPTDKVVCKLCKLALAYHSTTSNVRLHLQNVHPSEYGIICGTSAKQPRLDTDFAPSVTSSLPAARQEACTQKLISFICKDMRPISVVDGIGFREFCETLEPRYRIPSRRTVANRIIELYNSVCLILFNVNGNITSVGKSLLYWLYIAWIK